MNMHIKELLKYVGIALLKWNNVNKTLMILLNLMQFFAKVDTTFRIMLVLNTVKMQLTMQMMLQELASNVLFHAKNV